MVLAVALGGLLVDRFVLGSGFSQPKRANADGGLTPGEPAISPQALTVSKHVETAASRLSAGLGVTTGTDIGDAFGTSASWLVAAPIAPASKADQPLAEPVKPFADRHSLTGLSASRTGSKSAACVWVDKVKVELGGTVDGFKLICVNPQRREATFSGSAGDVVLTLQRPGVSENASIRPTNLEKPGDE